MPFVASKKNEDGDVGTGIKAFFCMSFRDLGGFRELCGLVPLLLQLVVGTSKEAKGVEPGSTPAQMTSSLLELRGLCTDGIQEPKKSKWSIVYEIL